MVRREKKFYSEEFKERALAAYQNSDESAASIAKLFGIKRDTFASWVYRKNNSPDSEKSDKLLALEPEAMKKEELSPEAMSERITVLQQQLSMEKMRSESLSKMIEITERELKIDIRKKTGAKQSLR